MKLTLVAFLVLHSRFIPGIDTAGRESVFFLAGGGFSRAGQVVASTLTLLRVAVKVRQKQCAKPVQRYEARCDNLKGSLGRKRISGVLCKLIPGFNNMILKLVCVLINLNILGSFFFISQNVWFPPLSFSPKKYFVIVLIFTYCLRGLSDQEKEGLTDLKIELLRPKLMSQNLRQPYS